VPCPVQRIPQARSGQVIIVCANYSKQLRLTTCEENWPSDRSGPWQPEESLQRENIADGRRWWWPNDASLVQPAPGVGAVLRVDEGESEAAHTLPSSSSLSSDLQLWVCYCCLFDCCSCSIPKEGMWALVAGPYSLVAEIKSKLRLRLDLLVMPLAQSTRWSQTPPSPHYITAHEGFISPTHGSEPWLLSRNILRLFLLC
jgi:hypothetical protein